MHTLTAGSNGQVAHRRYRVLAVDDDPMILRTARRLLSEDCDVVTAESTTAALDLLFGGQRFDVILSDVWMPGADGDGMSLFARVHEVAPLQASRIVYMTAGGLPDRLSRFIASRTVIAKPLVVEDVLAAFERVTGAR